MMQVRATKSRIASQPGALMGRARLAGLRRAVTVRRSEALSEPISRTTRRTTRRRLAPEPNRAGGPSCVVLRAKEAGAGAAGFQDGGRWCGVVGAREDEGIVGIGAARRLSRPVVR